MLTITSVRRNDNLTVKSFTNKFWMTQPNWTGKSQKCNQGTKAYKITKRKDSDQAKSARSKNTGVVYVSKNTQARKYKKTTHKFC